MHLQFRVQCVILLLLKLFLVYWPEVKSRENSVICCPTHQRRDHAAQRPAARREHVQSPSRTTTEHDRRARGEADTHVCGWVGSSPRETVSPWISLKHFSQKWYLSAISPNFGELHRSPKHGRSRTAHGREGSHRSVQDMGRVGCHERSKQEVGAQHSRKSSSQQPGMILRGVKGGGGEEGGRMGGRVFGGAWLVKAKASQCWQHNHRWGGREDRQVMEQKQDETTHSREPRQKHLLENLDMRGWATATTITVSKAGAESTRSSVLDGEEGELEQQGTSRRRWTNMNKEAQSCVLAQFI